MALLSKKVALVTGGRSGIGQAVAKKLQSHGASIVTAQRKSDPHFESIEADLTDAEVPKRVIEEVIQRKGQLDILINSAGIMQEYELEETSLETWRKTMAINLTAPFLLIQAATAALKKTKGCIVNIGSLEGLGANAKHSAYCASKAGLHGLTRAVAVDLGKHQVRCNAVAPGWIETDLNQKMVGEGVNQEQFQQELERIHPLGKTGTPEDVASVVAFLASEEASFITGQIYPVDGGRRAQLSLPRI